MGRKIAALCAVFALVLAVFGCDLADSAPQTRPENTLLAHFIDVGQGDAALILCGEKSLLVDAGTEKSAQKLVEFIQKQGVSRLDYVVATHPHADHIGGMELVLKTFEVGTFFMPNALHTTATFERMLDALAQNGAASEYLFDGVSFDLGEAKITALSPLEDEKTDNLNNFSAVLSVIYGENSILLTGDAEKEVEQRIAPRLSAHDILKVGHHGSNTSSTAEFLAAVSPKYAVICCGAGNEYGHPHSEVLERLAHTQVLSTDLCGTVTFTVSEGKIDVQTEKNLRP